MSDDDIRELAWDVITFHADDMRNWKEQLRGRTLDNWKHMVAGCIRGLSKRKLKEVAEKCWHMAEV